MRLKTIGILALLLLTMLLLTPRLGVRHAKAIQPVIVAGTSPSVRVSGETLINRSSLVSPAEIGFTGVSVHLEVPRIYLSELKAGFGFITEWGIHRISVEGAKEILLAISCVNLEGKTRDAFDELYLQISTQQGVKTINLLADNEEVTRFTEGENTFKVRLLGQISYSTLPWEGGGATFGLQYMVISPDGKVRAAPNLFVLEGAITKVRLLDSLNVPMDVFISKAVYKVGEMVEIGLNLKRNCTLYVLSSKILKVEKKVLWLSLEEEFQREFSLEDLGAGTHSFKREAVEEGYYVITVESSSGWRDYVEFYVAE